MIRSLLLLTLLTITANAQTGPCGSVNGSLLPNLVAYADVAKQTAFKDSYNFSATDCIVMDGVVSEGFHSLLRFTTRTGNVGQADLFLGDPADCSNLYDYDVCHRHYHIRGYTAYRLWTSSGYDNWVASRDLSQPITGTGNEVLLNAAMLNGDLVVSHKQGFCLIDTVCLSGNCYIKYPGGTRLTTGHYFSCNNQGLSVNWGDEYPADLGVQYGQFLITDSLLPGWYILEIQANPDHLLPESDYTDNSSAARVRL